MRRVVGVPALVQNQGPTRSVSEKMEPKLVDTIVCPACGAELPPSARVCARCGSATTASMAGGSQLPPAATCRAGRSLLDEPWFILGLLFLVTAVLGLPLLWTSRGFSRVWRIVLSVAVTLYTAALLWGFGLIMHWSVSRIIDSLR
jgi:ribosomal protein L40E